METLSSFGNSQTVAQQSQPNLHICEEGGRVGPVGLDILHGIPLVDRRLVRVDVALIVTDPREEEAPWIVVVAPCHFTSLMQTLQSRPSKGTTLVGLSFPPQAGIKH